MANLFEKTPYGAPEEDIRFRPFDEETAEDMTKTAAPAVPAADPAPAEPEEPVAEPCAENAALSADICGNIRMKLVSPRNGQDVVQIADYLIGGCAVILNTEHLNVQEMTRMMDFLDGVLYTVGGKHRRSSDKIFVLTPRSVNIAD